jgi:hypothetical protein
VSLLAARRGTVAARRAAGGGGLAPAAGYEIWLKADALTALSDGDPVATWADQSGNGHDATQATAANRPLYKTGIINGQPALLFDGSSDFLDIADDAAYKTANITVFVVLLSNSTLRTCFAYLHAATHTNPFFRWGLWHNNSNVANMRWNGTSYNSGGGTFGSAWTIAEMVDADLYLNGTLRINGTDADLTYPNATGIRLGANADGNEVLNGYIAEFILYPSSLSSTDRDTTRAYLQDKYAL